MRIPYKWLRDYVDIDLAPEPLAERLTLAGLEVDRVEYPWPGIIVGQIIWQERVKGSDHLWATRVTTGTEELSVVCGAPNIKPLDKVPLALVGSKVGEVTIAEKKALGVLSQGMLCSPRELGLSDDHEGIYILSKDAMIGEPLGKLLGDAVIDLDIKAHRGDLFCVVGVAREVAAFTGRELKPPKIAVKEKGVAAAKLMKLDVRDPDLCPRYTARVVRNVTLGPSPEWMAERLIQAGMRPINNIVDITNYVMLELGQPLHAFDYDKVADHTIIVRRAAPGEELTTLDGVTRRLTSDMLLITDPAGPNVIAGVFGGERVEVGPGTTNVLLEAAHFDPISIRRTSVALGLRTESSGRFEKNPDTELTAVAIDRAAQLLTELAGGTVAPGRVDFYPEPVQPRHIAFDLGQVEWLMGMPVARTQAIDALRALGFGVRERGDAESVVDVTVPTWRQDVEESADLVEEVARIVGYEHVPTTLPEGPIPAILQDTWFGREQRVREILVGAGLTEIITYSLTNRQAMAKLLLGLGTGQEALLAAPTAADAGRAALAKIDGGERQTGGRAVERQQLEAMAQRLPAITLRNPLSVEIDTLRLTLMSGLLATLRENSKHEDEGLWLFEVGRRYLPTKELADGKGLPHERPTLGVALTGPLAQSWESGVRDADYFDLKGVLESLLGGLSVAGFRVQATRHPTFHPGRCARLEVMALPAGAADVPANERTAVVPAAGWVPVGVLGEVHPEVARRFDLSGRVYLMELDLERLFLAVPDHARVTPIPRHPPVRRDLAVVVGDTTPEADVAEVIRSSGGGLLDRATLFDVYVGEGIPAGKKSLAYALSYQAPDRTLTEAEVERTHAAIVAALGKRLGAVLRG